MMATRTKCLLALAFTALFFALGVSGATHEILPTDTNFATTLNSMTLSPGDVVYFRGNAATKEATYDFAAFAGTYFWTGSVDQPIVIAGYPGETITLTSSNPNANILQLRGSYWVFKDFTIVGHSSAKSSIALRLMPTTSHVVLQNLKIHDLYQNAITANIGGTPMVVYENITMRGNEIWNTAGAGECVYVGCHGSGTTTACIIKNSLFENNYCHDTCAGVGGACTGGSMGSGFQIKFGSYRNIIRDNVCYRVNGPCVLLYDDWNLGQNLVEGNAILNQKGDSGIQVSAGALIRNNIVIGSSGSGISIPSNPANLYNGLPNRNIYIQHNTFVNNAEYGIYFGTTPGIDTYVINNVALGNTLGDFRSSVNMAGVAWWHNAHNSPNLPSGLNENATVRVGTVDTELVDAANFDVYPKPSSALIGITYPIALLYDFERYQRPGCGATLGAYEFSSQARNRWSVKAGFKIVSGPLAPCPLGWVCEAPEDGGGECTPPPLSNPTPPSKPSSASPSIYSTVSVLLTLAAVATCLL